MSDINGNPFSVKLEDSINRSFKIFERFCDNNDLDEAIDECQLHSNEDIYFSFLKIQFLILKALLTFEQTDLDRALNELLVCTNLCDSIRRKGCLSSLMKFIRTPDYDQYTDTQVHAQLTYAMCLAFYSVLSLLKSQTFFGKISTFKRLWSSKNSFKECRQIFRTRHNWEGIHSKMNFEAGISLERGFRHLFIGCFPTKFLSIAKLLGYVGVCEVAYDELTKSAYKLNGIYSRLAEFTILSYILFVEPVISVGRKRLDICDVILEKRIETHPNCIAYKLSRSKFTLINGELETSIGEFEQLLLHHKNIFNKISHWELMWIHALNCQWDESIKYSMLLREQTIHSPVISIYCEAVFRYFKSYKTKDNSLKAEATKLMKELLNVKPRPMGNTIMTFEKECIESATEYFNNGEYLFLPIMNLFYNGNLFYLIEGNVPLLERHLELVEDEMKVYLKHTKNQLYVKYYLDSLFYKGVLMKHMRRLIEAQHCFNSILEDIVNFNNKASIIPQTLMELGLIQMLIRNKSEAKKYFQKALKHFGGYTSESLLRIRIHSTIKDLETNVENEDKNHLNVTLIEQYARRVSELTKI